MVRRLLVNPAKGQPRVNMIMDSGAFSAWRLNKQINNIEYIDFLAGNMDWISHAVALDFIDLSDPVNAARISFENWKYAKDRGVITVPVVHAGESFDWIDRYLDAGCEYMGFSASSMRGGEYVDNWYSMVWDRLANSGGLPTIRTHCFGEGREMPLRRFPWQSADSTSWIYSAQRNGQVSIGKRKVSVRNDGLNERAQQDVGSLDELDGMELTNLLALARIKREGLEARGIESTVIRTYLAALNYMRMQARVNAFMPIKHQSNSFLPINPSLQPAVFIPKLNFHLVLGNNHLAWACMAHAGHMEGLVSFYYITKKVYFQRLREYVYDPLATCLQHEPMASHMRTLIKYSY
jgi:hypothetical protein